VVLGGELRREQVGIHLAHHLLGPDTEVMGEPFVDRDPPEVPVFHEYLLRNVLHERSVARFALPQRLERPPVLGDFRGQLRRALGHPRLELLVESPEGVAGAVTSAFCSAAFSYVDSSMSRICGLSAVMKNRCPAKRMPRPRVGCGPADLLVRGTFRTRASSDAIVVETCR
jgi:hypothetical protein